MIAFMKHSIFSRLVLTSAIGLAGCVDRHPDLVGERPSQARAAAPDDGEVVAKVDGEPVFSGELRRLIDEKDGGLDEEQALEALVRRELLTFEAQRRGWDKLSDVKDAKQKALARVLLREKIDKGINFNTLDKKKLNRYYEVNKERFVHGLQRRVMHILVLGGKKGLPDDKAREIAAEAAKRAENIKTAEEFVQFGDSFIKEHNNSEELKGKIKIEQLPPFSADTDQFVRPFVEAAFAVPKVGQSSNEIKTEFGWHVIFVQEEIPPINRQFSEVAEDLGQEVLPQEKQLRASEYIEKLYKNSDVFIFEDVLQNMHGSQ
jgi:peptidyl-prolyl cis-trans isomerase C